MDDGLKVLKNKVVEKFTSEFGVTPNILVKAPGRVNLIGEYTDLNHGYVLPMAIDRYLVAAVKKRKDRLINVFSMDYNEKKEINLDNLTRGLHSWNDYIAACMWVLKKHDYPLNGFDCVIAGNVPVGAGLSSSAALELAMLRAASWNSGFQWNSVVMAKLGQLAENEWVGVKCGIMDQIISSAGKENHALLIDCEDLSLKACPIPDNASVIILDTTTRRGLVDSAYNDRREQCFEAAKTLNVPYLRDATLPMLEKLSNQMSEKRFKCAKHVITENNRVLETATAMVSQDSKRLGELMVESHISLRDDFDVSGKALNAIVDCAMENPFCFGARMTGAGFAGCAVALVQKGEEQRFIREVSDKYQKKMGDRPQLYVCQASDGVLIEVL